MTSIFSAFLHTIFIIAYFERNSNKLGSIKHKKVFPPSPFSSKKGLQVWAEPSRAWGWPHIGGADSGGEHREETLNTLSIKTLSGTIMFAAHAANRERSDRFCGKRSEAKAERSAGDRCRRARPQATDAEGRGRHPSGSERVPLNESTRTSCLTPRGGASPFGFGFLPCCARAAANAVAPCLWHGSLFAAVGAANKFVPEGALRLEVRAVFFTCSPPGRLRRCGASPTPCWAPPRPANFFEEKSLTKNLFVLFSHTLWFFVKLSDYYIFTLYILHLHRHRR